MKRSIVGAAVLLALGTPGAAQAATESFTVTFQGKGTYVSDYDIVSSRSTSESSGSCIDHRHEDTHLQWSSVFHLRLQVGPRGVKAGEATAFPVAPGTNPSSVSTETHPGPDGDGCYQPSTGYSTAGTSDCKGSALPAGKEVLNVSAASAAGRTRLDVNGPLFKGSAFDGAWTYFSGSCAKSLDDRTLLLPDGVTLAQVLGANFPVKSSTWASLKRGRYFRVKVSRGHYAPGKLFPLDCTCQQRSLDWDGEVRIKRVA